jgi:hypothetical protein
MSFRVTMLFCLLVAVMTGFGEAQVAPERPTSEMLSDVQPVGSEPTYLRFETPAQRAARIGTEDPGPDPDPKKEFVRFGKTTTISRFDRRWAVYNSPTCHDAGFIRPFGGVNVCRELYQHNDKYVWVWMPKADVVAPGDAAAELQAEPPAAHRFSDREIDYLSDFRSEFSDVQPAESNMTLRFEESSQGLPAAGSFRNSLAVADMNGDGNVDVIIPPERGTGAKTPQIFLGDGKGGWTKWAVRWPRTLDYGNVVAADVNGDKRNDLVFGVHLRGVYVFINEGEGRFTDSDAGLPRNYPTRRVTTADVDGDGALDIVALSEGPTLNRDPQAIAYGKMRAFLNRDKGRRWEAMDIVGSQFNVGSDWLSVGNFNGDKIPDFALGSIYFGAADTLWLSMKRNAWKSLASTDGVIVPGLSYFHANAVGRFRTKSKLDDAVVSFVRFWPGTLDAKVVPPPVNQQAAGIDFLAFDKSGVKRTPIMRWGSRTGIWGLGAGDLDGDGDLDVAFSRYEPRETVALLGDGKGGFKRATVEGLTLKPNANYDLQIADVNNDGRDDVLVMYETSAANNMFAPRDGAVQVFLSRGLTPSARQASAK